ncbi:hypothetical protein BC831DRAFT_406839 [Entophlyctis helioformis]|nr:hypothetical protein BC831DRAFT_406839 [Entophlyctis helioformis]
MTPASRIGGAKAMYREYLSATRASFPLRWPTDINDPTIEEIIDAITSCLESPDPTILDDISFVAMQTLESIYAGTYMPSDGENDFHMSAEAYEIKRFRKSAFYQAMRNDLRGTLHVTTIQHTRAIERLADLASTVPADAVVWEKIFSTLEGIFPEADSVVSKSINLARKRTTSVQAQQAQVQVQAHAALGRTRSTSSLRGDNDDTPASQPATKSRNISVQSTVSRAFDSSAPSHTFLPYTMNEHMFCEYCNLKLALDKGTDDALSAHRCESCGYLCHRNCRNLIRVTCSKPSAAIDLEVGPEVHSEKLRLVTEKLGALQKEIDIEMKIRDGLEKITKAKHGGGSGGSGGGSGMKLGKSGKKSQQEMDVTSQLDRNSKRLEMLKHELQKRRLQMQSLQQQANAQEALQQAQDLERNAGSDSANGSRSAISASLLALSSSSLYGTWQPNTGGSAEDLQDGGLIRVAIEDPTTKMQSKKAIYIKENQSTLEVITRIMEKANLTGSPNDFVLVYAGPKGDSILVKDEDRPLQLENVDFSHTFFKARSDKNFHAPRDPNTPQIKKQREILSEILDSENNYCQDIKNAFLSPFEASGLLDVPTLEQIFSNIQEISAVHDSLGKALKEVSEDISPGPIIKCFTDAVPHFKCYTTYCGNQHHARRILGRMSSDTAFQKLLQKCESNPKLHKLTIADMLVKPMHRITRYPLLFKRLLPNLDTNSHEHIALTGLLIEIEAIISNVNDTLKKREAAYRIRLMDEILDFGVVAERFTIAVDGRELISEKPLMYHKKSSNVPVDVTLMVFSDMIMMVRPKKGDHLQLFKPPMPLESVVLLDKPDASEKTMFQIVHLEQETYLMQALSVYDKNSWLQEAESTRARFCALHYDIEQAYVRMQTGRYKLLNLARQPAEYDDRPPLSAYDDNYSSSLSLPFKVKRRTSDASTRKGLPINDADRIRNEETPTIKRNSSLLQLFKMRRNDDPSSQPQSQNPSQMQQQLSGGDDYGTPTTAGIPDDPNGQGALFFGTGHLGGFGGGGSLGGGSAGSGSASIASSRQDTRMSTARGSMGDAIQERPEIPSPASQSPNLSATSASAIAGGSAGANALSTSKSRLVRKETAGKRLSSIFRFSTPALDTSLSSPTKDRSSISPLSAQDRPSMAVLDQATDVTVSSGFDIDSFLAEGGAGGVGGPENMSAVNQQAEKRRSGIGVMGKVRRSLKPQQGSTSPGPMTPQPADTSPTRRDLDE